MHIIYIMYACMYACILYVCMYVVCMVCMYVCMYTCLHVHVHVSLGNFAVLRAAEEYQLLKEGFQPFNK